MRRARRGSSRKDRSRRSRARRGSGALAPAAAGVVLELGVLALGGTFGGPSSPR